LRLAAIDIGSNAARLLITEVANGPQGNTEFIKTMLVRVPSGSVSMSSIKGMISPGKAEKIIKTIKSYRLLLDVYDVKHFRACATSAMRDASNGPDIIKQVKAETGLDIEIISGDQEASLIYENTWRRIWPMMNPTCI
jgi:exopolyphosphatase/guanosine-5'-triphosphate,3'-diphosphate pyrophosphatase